VTSVLEKIDDTTVKITVTRTAEEFAPAMKNAYERVGASLNIPGFRKGKAPSKLIEQRVGRGAVIEQAVNDNLAEWYAEAVDENDVRPLGRPEIELTKIPAEADSKDGIEFTATVEVRPEFTLPPLADITVEVEPAEVTDEDIDARMVTLRERFATLKTVDRPAKDGDFVILDLSAQIDGKDVDAVQGTSYQVGSGNMLDGLDDVIIGLSADEVTTYDGPLAAGEHAGQQAHITVKVTGVKERELPEPDDEFAQLASEFDTVAELRDDLATQAQRIRANNQAIMARDGLVETLLDKVDIELPKKRIEQEVHDHLAGENRLEDDEHRAEVTAEATAALSKQIILDQLVEDLNVEVDENELLNFMLNISRQYGTDPTEFIENAQKQGQVPAFAAEVARSKAASIALRQVTVKDTAGADVDLSAAIGTGEEDEETA